MALGVVYQSDFYNVDGKLVTVKFWKEGGSGATVIRTQEVSITCNYQGDDVPIVGTGAKITFINNSGSFTTYDDLLSATEKEFKVTIEWNSLTVFEGYVVCDLNEQQMLDYSSITIQATNYLRRLEDTYLTRLNSIIGKTNLLNLLFEAHDFTELEYVVYVNSTLFELIQVDNANSTFLTQTAVESSLFWVNQDEWEDTYKVLNKILLPFNCFMYQYGQRWVVERYRDIARVGDWVKYDQDDSTSGMLGDVTASLKQEINKQDGDFEYINSSQVLQYNSGAQMARLNLQDKIIETLVYNDYSTPVTTTAAGDYPLVPYLAALNTWYINENCANVATGVWYGELSKYIYFTGGVADTWQCRGIYYAFRLQFNSATKPTELTVSYKIKTLLIPDLIETFIARFYLAIHGTLGIADQFIAEDSGGVYIDPALYVFEQEFNRGNLTSLFEVSKTIQLDDIYSSAGTDVLTITLGILPPYWQLHFYETWEYLAYHYIGDIKVAISPEEIDNQIDYELNENFIKTEEVDLHCFDLDNLNYSNGFLYIDMVTKTSAWMIDGVSVFEPLVDVFAKSRFSKLYKTLRSIVGTIKCDLFLKPFCILTDDNISDESIEDPVKFILTNFTWDLVNGTYDIVAEEYPDEVITVDGS